MSNLEEIRSRGRIWLDAFREIDFVGDLEVSEREIDDLTPLLGKVIERASWDDEICAALAVVVVNLAYYSSNDTEESFRWHVLKKLFARPLQDVNLWQDRIGAPVLRILKRHFYVDDLPGPFRYVRPIMLQAGVPTKLSNAFAAFFVALSKKYGLQFSEGDYIEAFTQIAVQSSWLRSFLRANGWEYSRDVARILRNVEEGILTQSDILTLPPRFRQTVEQIKLMLAINRPPTRASEQLPLPKLVLDRNSLRLAIDFSEKALDGGYWNSDGTKIRTTRYFLQEQDFIGRIKGRMVHKNGRREDWEIVPWRPGEQCWATFRTTDGSIETSSNDSNGRLARPGRKLIVVPGTSYIPEELIIEELGDLFLPGFYNLHIRVFECELPAEFELPEIGLRVGASTSENSPELRFGVSANRLPFATNTFVGALPEIVIEHWSPNFTDRYLLIHNEGKRTYLLPENLYCTKASFHLPIHAFPTNGSVLIEPKGRTPKGFAQVGLNYTLLPEGKMGWPSQLHASNDAPVIEITPGHKFVASWQQPTIHTEAPGRWRVPPKLDYVDGQISFENQITFNVAGPVYRFSVHSSLIAGNILWQDDLQTRSSITLFLSNNESCQRIELGVSDRKGFIKCIGLGPVPPSARLELSTDSIRDAFQSRSPCAGRLAVRVRNGSVVISDIIFLHDLLIKERIFNDDNDEFDSWIECVPDGLRIVLDKIREMPSRPVRDYSLDGLMAPDHLMSLLKCYDACGRTLDWNERIADLETLQESLRSALNWYSLARSFTENETSVNPGRAAALLEKRPKLSRVFPKFSPKQRWRVKFANALRALRDRKSLTDYRRLINSWSSKCRGKQWVAALHSRIGKISGGQMLTDAAQHYHLALEFRESDISKSREYFARANNYLERLLQNKPEGLIWELAVVLRFMIFFHTQHPQAKQCIQPINTLGPHWANFKMTATALVECETNSHYNDDSIRLSDVAPHEADVQLEKGLRV